MKKCVSIIPIIRDVEEEDEREKNLIKQDDQSVSLFFLLRVHNNLVEPETERLLNGTNRFDSPASPSK